MAPSSSLHSLEPSMQECYLMVVDCCPPACLSHALQVDTAKDMVDNCAGMILALLALATRGANSASTPNGDRNRSRA